jgi:hypothetical protein
MRNNDVDMWIHVLRESNRDPLAGDFGSNSGVFVFTDRGGDKVERAALGLRWKDADFDVVEECGAYDIVGEAIERGELPGGPEAEYEHRFKGFGEFVAERDPNRIALNYREKHGPPLGEGPQRYRDGLSHTDYLLLAKAIGDKYTKRIVSSEFVRMDYLLRAVKSKIALHKKLRKENYEHIQRQFAKIVPGVTKNSDLERRATIMRPDRSRTPADYVFQRGDFVQIGAWYAYALREGETEPPPELQKVWADGWKIRKVIEDNVKVGRSGGETYDIVNQKLEEAGFITSNRHQYYKDLDPEKTQVSIDCHGLEEDPYPARIGPFGPDWMRDGIIQPLHHFTTEYFVYMPLPHLRHEVIYKNLWFHDGAYVTEDGVEYLYPAQKEIILIK